MRKFVNIILVVSILALASCSRDPFVRTMREGAKAYDEGDYTRAAGLFKQTLQDTTFAGLYNYALASHEAEDDIEAIRALDTLRKQELVPEDYAVPAVLNLANACLTEAVREEAKENSQEQPAAPEQGAVQQGQKASTGLYQQAMQAYEEYLLEVPEDMDAKERYLFCKSKMPPQDGGGGGGSDQNQDQQNQDQQNQDQDQNQDQQNQDQNQDQQDQNQDQNDQQDQNQDQQQQPQDQDRLNEEQIYKMLEAKEKETRDKLDEKKARAIQLRQKDRKKW